MAQWIVDGLTATISGIATVFIVLIIIALIIGSLKHLINPFKTINRIQGISRRDVKKQDETIEVHSEDNLSIIQAEDEEEIIDDLTLVAIITATIASTLEVSEDKLVVRSIKRVNDSGNWSRRRSNQ